MGTDIHGYAEAYDRSLGWRAVFDIAPLVFRNYRMFGLLFGVRDLHAVPIAARRGLPDDASRVTGESYQRYARYDDVHSVTWILWKELAAINWEDEARTLEQRGLRYSDWASNEWDYLFKRLKPLVAGAEKQPHKKGITAIDWKALAHDMECERAELKKRGQPLDIPNPDWRAIFHLLQQLAVKSGPQHVRLVVWFDG